MPWQHNCPGMCKFMIWLYHYHQNWGKNNSHKISVMSLLTVCEMFPWVLPMKGQFTGLSTANHGLCLYRKAPQGVPITVNAAPNTGISSIQIDAVSRKTIKCVTLFVLSLSVNDFYPSICGDNTQILYLVTFQWSHMGLCHLKSQATRQFIQQLVRLANKEHIKACDS